MALENKTVLLVGIPNASGMDIPQFLLEEGVGRLLFACRTKEEGERILEKLNFSERVSILNGLDLFNPESITGAIGILPEGVKIDAMFFQAAQDEKERQFITWKGKKIESFVFQNTVGVRLVFHALKKRKFLAQGARVIVVGSEGNKGLPSYIEKPQFHSIKDLRNYIGGGDRLFLPSMPLVFLNFSLPFGFWKWQPKRAVRNLFGMIPAAK